MRMNIHVIVPTSVISATMKKFLPTVIYTCTENTAKKKQKWLAEEDSYSATTFTDRNGDDDAVAAAADDDSCRFNSAVIALYDPCIIDNVIGLDTQGISQLQIWPSFLRTSHRGYYYAPLWKYTINRR